MTDPTLPILPTVLVRLTQEQQQAVRDAAAMYRDLAADDSTGLLVWDDDAQALAQLVDAIDRALGLQLRPPRQETP